MFEILVQLVSAPALKTLSFFVARQSHIPAVAFIFAFVSLCLGVAVRTYQPQVFQSVIERVAVLVIQFNWRGSLHPLSDAADFAMMPSNVK